MNNTDIFTLRNVNQVTHLVEDTILGLPLWLSQVFDNAGVVLTEARHGNVDNYFHFKFLSPVFPGTVIGLFTGSSFAGLAFQQWHVNNRNLSVEELVSFLEV